MCEYVRFVRCALIVLSELSCRLMREVMDEVQKRLLTAQKPVVIDSFHCS
jgi:hypothetical protein